MGGSRKYSTPPQHEVDALAVHISNLVAEHAKRWGCTEETVWQRLNGRRGRNKIPDQLLKNLAERYQNGHSLPQLVGYLKYVHGITVTKQAISLALKRHASRQ